MDDLLADLIPDAALTPEARAEKPGLLLIEIIKFLSRFVAFPNNHQKIAIALWILHTYVMDAAETTPYLLISSPEKRSGKTRLLEAIELLILKPYRFANPTEAVLFRKIEQDASTILFDEFDTIFKDKNGTYEGIRAILNAGYRRGTTVPRCVGEGKNIVVKEFSVFCPKALSGIGKAPDTVADRSIPIRLKRRSNEPVERFLRRRVEPTAAPIRKRLQAWADDNLSALKDANPVLPDELNDRAADGWEPLFAIADLIGGEWPEKARTAAKTLHAEDNEESLGTLLLSHIQRAFNDKEKMFTTELLKALVAEEEGPWAEWWGDKVECFREKGPASNLAKLLKPFEIKPKTIRIDKDTFKGYEKGQFEDAFNRYLSAPLPLSGENKRHNVTPQAETPETPFPEDLKKEQNKAIEQECYVVTFEKSPKTTQRVFAAIREATETAIHNFWNGNYPVYSDSQMARINEMRERLDIAASEVVTQTEFKNLCNQFEFINTRIN